jgi:hypothetical protein
MKATDNATLRQAAAWMYEKLYKPDGLYHEHTVYELEKKYQHAFTYTNDYGNVAIDRDLLKEFRAVSGDDVVWDRADRCWRKRTKRDKPGRMQG